MKCNHPKWRCEACGKLVTELSYCQICWKMACSNCYDPYVGSCKHCAENLFAGIRPYLSKEVNHVSGENLQSISPRHHRDIVTRCKECKTQIIITPDKTKCCPRCGLVIGRGYSWIGHSFNPPPEDHSTYFPIDNSEW